MNEFYLILDVDDVARNLKDEIEKFAYVYYHGDMKDFKYHYTNKKCRAFMDWWVKKPDEYYHLFENAKWNMPLFNLIFNEFPKINLFFLSSNKDKKAIELTIKQILKKLEKLESIKKNKDDSIIFVPSATDKVKYVENNIGTGKKFGSDKSKILFVDDRLDTVKSFADKGIRALWYTDNIPEDMQKEYLSEFGDYGIKGGFKMLSKYMFLVCK